MPLNLPRRAPKKNLVDLASWNAVLLRSSESEKLNVKGYPSYPEAAITYYILPDTKEKIEFTFGLYMRTFYVEPTGLFFSMLEI